MSILIMYKSKCRINKKYISYALLYDHQYIQIRINFLIKKNKLAYLYPVVFFITNVDESQVVRSDPPRVAELAIRPSLVPESPHESSGGIEHLQSVVVAVRHDVLTDPVDRHRRKAVEFSLVAAIRTKFLNKFAGRVKNLEGGGKTTKTHRMSDNTTFTRRRNTSSRKFVRVRVR